VGAGRGLGLTFIRKQVANTGQLRRRLYHIPISFVRDWADGLEARIGERMMGDRDNRSRDRRLINLERQTMLYRGSYSSTYVDFRTRVLNSRSLSISSFRDMDWINLPPDQSKTSVQLQPIPQSHLEPLQTKFHPLHQSLHSTLLIPLIR
jgi:hypothetical protein